MVRSIADAVVIKQDDLFFLTEPNGRVPLDERHGFGLYYRDCRYLNGYELKVAGTDPTLLVSAASRDFMAVVQLTNADLRMKNGRFIPKETIGIKWERAIDAEDTALDDLLTLQSFSATAVEFSLALTFRAEFEDIYTVRELLSECPGKIYRPEWKKKRLRFLYHGNDALYRALSVHFDPAPHSIKRGRAEFRIRLRPRESKRLRLLLVVEESETLDGLKPSAPRKPLPDDRRHPRPTGNRSSDQAEICSDSLLLNRVISRSMDDLHMLKSHIGEERFFAAGIPWFSTLFGRDSLLTALQVLAYHPEVAEETLRVLANHQGDRVDDWRDEQPGKILHELRIGELARMGEIPHTPYYGTVDATLLFLILVGQHAAWTGELTLFHELRKQIERALEWAERYGDLDGDGYIEYRSTSKKGLINQGWKDSGDAIVNEDGSLARPPIALIEVQGYLYQAKRVIADLFLRAGESGRAERLRKEAKALRARFNRDFWVKEKGFYAMALEAGKKQVAVLSSNPGHALWSGIADPDKAHQTAEKLMANEMFNGWGIRTLSEKERRYNPVSYHLGSVWPHDNAFIAAGFRRYGLDEAACRIFTGMLEAAMHFEDHRLPELFSGFRREEYGVPVCYPVACHPQAWAAGAVPYLVATGLGLVPEGFDRRLRIVRPILPDFIKEIEVRRMKVGQAAVDLKFFRVSDKTLSVEVLKVDGTLDVVVDTEPAPFEEKWSAQSFRF